LYRERKRQKLLTDVKIRTFFLFKPGKVGAIESGDTNNHGSHHSNLYRTQTQRHHRSSLFV
ncbi:hypothetical protein, partial [Nodularia spumigena]|uniref:hypothetical protein n=1 Tax=Nodularia spumigena TaxID=70799 RepID=UPI001E4113B0